MAKYVKVIAADAGWTKVQDEDGNVFTIKGDRNWRNNNPGNLEYGPFAKAHGAIGTDGRFAVFPDVQTGDAARSSLQFEKYGNLTLEQMIAKYAPSNENNTESYTNQVANAAGVSRGTLMKDLTPEQRQRFLDAQKKVEGFRIGKVFREDGTRVPIADVPEGPSSVPGGIDLGQVAGGNHVVGKDETLSGIAAKYKVSVRDIQLANGIKDVNKIQAGKSLVIPGTAAKGTGFTSELPQDAGFGVKLPAGAPKGRPLKGQGMDLNAKNEITPNLMAMVAPKAAPLPVKPANTSTNRTIKDAPEPVLPPSPFQNLRASAAVAASMGNQSRTAAVGSQLLESLGSGLAPSVAEARSESAAKRTLTSSAPAAAAKVGPSTPALKLTDIMGNNATPLAPLSQPAMVKTTPPASAPPAKAMVTPSPTPNGGFGFSINLGDMLNAAKDTVVNGAQTVATTVQAQAPKIAAKATDQLISAVLASPAARGAIINPMIAKAFTDKPAGYGKGSSEVIQNSGQTLKTGDSFKGTSNSGKSYVVGQQYKNSRGQIVTAQADGSFR